MLNNRLNNHCQSPYELERLRDLFERIAPIVPCESGTGLAMATAANVVATKVKKRMFAVWYPEKIEFKLEGSVVRSVVASGAVAVLC